MRFLLAGCMLLAVAGCASGVVHPDHGDGAAAAPATQGGLAGAQEGSPDNARNLGTGPSTVIGQ